VPEGLRASTLNHSPWPTVVITEQKGPGPSLTLALSTMTTKYRVGIGDEVGVVVEVGAGVGVGVAVPVSSAETRDFSAAISFERRLTSVAIVPDSDGDCLPGVTSLWP